jgi:RNA polymerase sigma factor (sigma-70 family)
MADFPPDTTSLLDLFSRGDEQARSALLLHARVRLQKRASQMLRRYPTVKRWEETDDVMQDALIRLNRTLSKVSPQSSLFFWNLAARHINWALLDLCDHYKTALEVGNKHHTGRAGKAADEPGGKLYLHADSTGGPDSLEDWTRFHEAVAQLPDDERKVFGLRWYDGFTLEQVAELMGMSVRTIKRRWRSAQILLKKALGGEFPS